VVEEALWIFVGSLALALAGCLIWLLLRFSPLMSDYHDLPTPRSAGGIRATARRRDRWQPTTAAGPSYREQMAKRLKRDG
jgi:hypothetical protein